MLSQPHAVQLRPLRNRGETIGIRNRRADGNHDHISQAVKPIDLRPRVRQNCRRRFVNLTQVNSTRLSAGTGLAANPSVSSTSGVTALLLTNSHAPLTGLNL